MEAISDFGLGFNVEPLVWRPPGLAEYVAGCVLDAETLEHSRRVAGAFQPGDAEVDIAWLHDVVEDAPDRMPSRAIHALFGDRVADAVAFLTRGPAEVYAAYIDRICFSGNRDALEVKTADICDHLHPVRVRALTDSHRKRYEQALELLLEARNG